MYINRDNLVWSGGSHDLLLVHCLTLDPMCSGLDNAGKTTIVKKFLGEDVTTISPTFGFNIQTVEHRGWGMYYCAMYILCVSKKYFLIFFSLTPIQTQPQHLGRGRSKVA